MSTLQIHILAGQQAGARLQLNESPVTFGRSSECTLVLDLPVVSRLHGELQVNEEGQWVLVNHSTNGTRVGRKKATKKPLPLTDGTSIIIGDEEVFRVHLDAASASVPADADDKQPSPPTGQAPGASTKDRSKLWIGLGVWFAMCIAAMVFFATLGGNGKNDENNDTDAFYFPQAEGLTGEEGGIRAIRRLLAEHVAFQDPNASRYSTHLDRADQAADQGPSGLYQAYAEYQKAISFSDNHADPLKDSRHVQRYNRIVDELAEIIYKRYIYAYRAYRDSDYAQARQVLEALRDQYYRNEDPNDPLANHIRKLRNAAHDKAG